jgi:hypothetical protein
VTGSASGDTVKFSSQIHSRVSTCIWRRPFCIQKLLLLAVETGMEALSTLLEN